MRIAGLQRLTLLDFPDRTAATVFCPGCDFRCPFCHNASLVIPGPEGFPALDEGEVRAFLEKRRGILDGVCITGGEPLLQSDIAQFCADIKAMGFAVKLDTNGSFPAALKDLVGRGVVDYVAMDMKAAVGLEPADRGLRDGCASCDRSDGFAVSGPHASALSQDDAELGRFAAAVGVGLAQAASIRDAVRESAAFLLGGAISYEFRTTVVRELHDASHLAAIARDIQGAEAWYLQGFVDSDGVIAGRGAFHSYSAREMRDLADVLRRTVPSVRVRGVD